MDGSYSGLVWATYNRFTEKWVQIPLHPPKSLVISTIQNYLTYPEFKKNQGDFWTISSVTLDSRQYLLEFQKETILNLLILWEDFYKHSSICFVYFIFLFAPSHFFRLFLVKVPHMMIIRSIIDTYSNFIKRWLGKSENVCLDN